jgi:hypothetical protein
LSTFKTKLLHFLQTSNSPIYACDLKYSTSAV